MSISEQNTTTLTRSPLQESAVKTRIHYLDHIRALAMLLGVFFHAAFSYAEYTQSVWLTTDIEKSFALEVFIWFGHLFRMALFFLIAGFFANLMVQKRGVFGFLKNRALRLGL
ncbi:MAG: acyltransferase family protein, partial [Candidatus Latescibacteria bacterium]|nr:acyltransferase family protein [Candidatus Latescibacterota bacterium]